MTRTVYHIAGKDYEKNAECELTFNVLAVSIHNFLTIAKQEGCHVKWFGKIYTDSQRTTTNGDIKTIILRAYSPVYLINLAKKLGKKDWDCLDNNWNIRNSELRAQGHATNRFANHRYTGILVFDPLTKNTKLVSNSPVKILGKQLIFSGKLYRKYYGPDMR